MTANKAVQWRTPVTIQTRNLFHITSPGHGNKNKVLHLETLRLSVKLKHIIALAAIALEQQELDYWWEIQEKDFLNWCQYTNSTSLFYVSMYKQPRYYDIKLYHPSIHPPTQKSGLRSCIPWNGKTFYGALLTREGDFKFVITRLHGFNAQSSLF